MIGIFYDIASRFGLRFICLTQTLHGTISHFNVDMRMGWLNYVFVGPELHRYHHSAKSHEAVNYGATVSLFDLLFYSFLYRQGVPPLALGLKLEDGYPGQIAPLNAFLFPLASELSRRRIDRVT